MVLGGVVATVLLLAGMIVVDPSSQSGAQGNADQIIERLAGDSRFGTAAAIALSTYPDGAPVVYLARADVFADAVAAGVVTDGPVLLVPSCGEIPQDTARAVGHLDPAENIVLGGSDAICDEVVQNVAESRPVTRLYGDSRYSTAAQISRRAFPDEATRIYLTSGDFLADSVAAGVVTDGPILLLPSEGAIPEDVTSTVARLGPTQVVVLGGEAALPQSQVSQLAPGSEVVRLAGRDRIETAVAISGHVFPDGAETVYLARADLFADAVAAAPLTSGPVLLVPSCGGLPPIVTAELGRLRPGRVVALGGPAAVCDGQILEALDHVAGEDSECLARSGPRQVIEGDQFAQFRVAEVADDTVFDASSAIWTGLDLDGQPIPWTVTLRGDPLLDQRSCWYGGVIRGPWDDTDPDVTWEDPYHHSGGMTITSPSMLVEDVRIDNQGDGIRPYAPDVEIRSAYLSDIHDDCVENDDLYSVTIVDSLFDGCYVGFSARPVIGTDPDGYGNRWVIRDSLLRLEPQPTVYRGQSPGHGGFFKWDDAGRAPAVALHNTILYASQPPNHGTLGLPEGLDLAECSNNVMVWTGPGDFPEDLPSCFEITNDQQIWDAAVADWMARHEGIAGLPPS